MWLASIVPMVGWLVAAAQPGGAAPAAQPLPEPVATRQTLFVIPFRIDPADQAAREPVEVQLHVSGDRGATWQLYSKVEPTRQQFMFRAGGDGEFWFLVRTVDRSGQVKPEGRNTPALRVIVDTLPPRLQLEARRGLGGQITARWKVDEPHPKPENLSIQYRTTADGPWQTVAVDRRHWQISGATQTGEVTWWPQPGSQQVQVRAEVQDAAGNPAVSQAQVDLGKDNSPDPARTAKTPPAASDDGSVAWRPGQPEPPANPWPASMVGNVNPPIRNQYVAPEKSAPGAADSANLPALTGTPPGERPRWVNSRRFELEYDVESIGPSEIAKVELWATRDGGRTWKSFAADDDRRSPLQVTVDEEGVYGFRIVVQSAAGLGTRPPQSGDLPDILIGVDWTKPAARIIAAEKGTSAEANSLVISWEANDKMLAARPVSLSFSDNARGPWTPIASGLENTGRYVWPADNRLPQQIYLRLEVRDEAGNVGAFEATQPVSVEQFRPSVRIRDVRPLGETSQRPGPKRYYLR